MKKSHSKGGGKLGQWVGALKKGGGLEPPYKLLCSFKKSVV